MAPVLREKYPNSKIIALHIDESLPPMPDGIPTFYAAGEASVQKFLEAEVPQTDASNIMIIEWRPSMDFYKRAYVKLLSQVVEFIKREDAVKRTEGAFGKRWIKNFFRNLDYVQNPLLYKPMDIPVIITGSGPSLEKALPLIRKAQDTCLIIAASSSAMALANGGVTADIVIATDGGSWALRHIYECFRNESSLKNFTTNHTNQHEQKTKGNFAARLTTRFAGSLCAALPSQCAAAPFLIINDGSFWQSVVFHELNLPSVIVPQRGTVTASAVELALVLSGGNIYLAGMDLSVLDIRTHARPYAFDHLLFDKASRFSPVYSQSFVKSAQIQMGGGLDIYAAWFKNQLSLWPKRIFSLGGGNDVFSGADSFFADTDIAKNTGIDGGQKGKKIGEYFKQAAVANSSGNFRKRAEAALLGALENGQFADNIKAELTPLVFPGKKEALENDLRAELTKLIKAETGNEYNG